MLPEMVTGRFSFCPNRIISNLQSIQAYLNSGHSGDSGTFLICKFGTFLTELWSKNSGILSIFQKYNFYGKIDKLP